MANLSRWIAAALALGLAGWAHAASDDVPPLKELHLDTVLAAGGVSQCRIAAPADPGLQAEARRVQAALRRATGIDVDLVDAASVTDEDCHSRHHIALGNFANNAVIAKLYARHLCFTDAFYPGRGGHELRTIHNPLGWGKNCVLLGGSDLDGVRAATDGFLARLASPAALSTGANGTVTLHRLLDVAAPSFPFPVPDDAYVASRVKTVSQGLDGGLVRSQMGGFNGVLDAALRHCFTGQDGWARIFRGAMLHYHALAQPTSDWALLALSNDPGGQYFWPWKLAIAWDNIEESPVFSDDDRRKITQVLLNITRWVAACDHFDLNQQRGATYGSPGDLRQGHSTYAAISMFFCDEYFRMYYPDLHEFEPRRADVARIFAGQAGSYKSNDNANGYAMLAPAHYLAYQLTRGELGPRDDRNLRALADSVVITTDNRGDACTYGDGANFQVGYPRGALFLSKAAWRFGDPGLRWAFDWIHARSWGEDSARDPGCELWSEGIYATDGPRAVPERLCGIAPVMVDQGLYDFMRRSPRQRTAAPPPPLAQCFDKLSLRRNFSAPDEYLLLSGLSGVLVHGHDDGNSVLRLTWNDRIWLANLGYRSVDANEHNGLMVRRDGRYQSPPPFTSLETRADLPDAAFTRTVVRDYHGVDWRRNILWRKGESFLFFDEVDAHAPGKAQLQLGWRLLGNVALADGALRAEQAGEVFTVAGADTSRKVLAQKRPDRNSDWSPYPHADGTVSILAERCDISAGGRHVFINLLHPGEPSALTVERIGERTARLRRGGRVRAIAGLAAAGNETDAFHVTAAAYQISPDGIAVFDARRVAVAGLDVECDAPVSFTLDWRSSEGTWSAAEDTRVSIHATGVQLDGRQLPATSEAGALRCIIPSGTHSVRLAGLKLSPPDDAFFAHFPALTHEPAAAAESAPPLAARWRFKAPAPLRALATGDLGGSGRVAVVIATGNEVRALSDTGEEKWVYRAPAAVKCLQLADLDHDGKMEVIFGAGPTLFRLNAAGVEQWRHECTHFKTPLATLAIADLERDGRLEILAGNEYSALFAVNADGTERWHSYKDIGRAGITALLAGDFNGDGRSEVFVGTSRDHGAVLLDEKGEQVRWKIPGTHHVARATAHAMMVGGPQGRGPARIVDPITGRTRQLVPLADDVTDLAVGEFFGDGAQQFVAAFAGTGVRVFDESGRQRLNVNLDSFASRLAVADFAGRGRPQIAVGAQDGKLLIVDSSGAAIARAELPDAIVALAVTPGPGRPCLVAAAGNGTVASFEVKP